MNITIDKGRAMIQNVFFERRAEGFAGRSILVAASLGLACGISQAQESVNKELDKCVRDQQVRSAAKGALAGALVGFLKSAVDDSKSKDTGKNVVIGAAVGGAAGFATAYFTAVKTCYKKNPSWVPETQLKRGADYAQVKEAIGYKPSMGVVAKTVGISVPNSIRPGEVLPLQSRFVALTPDGAEAEVVIERRLFAIFEGKETAVPFPGVDREQRKVEAGEQTDQAKISLPSDMPVGTALRYEFSIAVAGMQPSVATAQTVVR